MTIKRRLYDNILQRDIAKSYKKYSSMKNMTYKDIEEYRLKNLKWLVLYSYKYIPFYKELWDSCNVNPDIKSLKDFEKFPIVDKKMLKKAIQDWTLFSTEFKTPPKLVWQHTTWSTWNPFEFPFTISEEADKNWCPRMYEEWYSWRTFDDKKARVRRWKYKKNIIDIIKEYLTNTYEVCIYDPNHTKETFLNDKRLWYLSRKLLKLKPKYIETFPSALAEIAKYMKKNKLEVDFQIDWIISWAEQLLSPDKTILSDVFWTNVFDRYGWTDASLMAFQCQSMINIWNYHVDELRIYLEAVDEHNDTIYDKPWQTIITDLWRKYAPFIRYRVWDYITISSDNVKKCSCCWIYSRTISSIWWRFNDTIELLNWNKISPHLWQNILKKYDFIDTYQIIKKKENDFIVIKIVWNEEDKEWLNLLHNELKSAFEWIQFDFEFVDNIDRNIWWKISQILIEK